MLRRTPFVEGEYYHVYNRGVEKRSIFSSNADRMRFVHLLYLSNGTKPYFFRDHIGQPFGNADVGSKITTIGAYVLMPNHFHLLMRETKVNGITEFMRKLGTGYARYFNEKHKRVGPLFQGRFKATHVDSDEYLKYLFSYIHLNPIKLIDPNWRENGIADREKAKQYLEFFPFSSYMDYAGEKRPQGILLDSEAFPDYFHGRSDFKQQVHDWLNYNEE